MWALGLLYSGRAVDAATLLDEHRDTLALSECGGFVPYTRAEVAATTDPDLALGYLAESSRIARETESTFSQRLTDISQLVLLVGAGRRNEAASLALTLVPQLMRAGTTPQAWTALRHVADLLGQLGSPQLGLRVLESAVHDVGAPAVVGAAVRTEDELRARLRAQAGSTPSGSPVSLPALWDDVQPVLRHTAEDGPGRRGRRRAHDR